MLTVGGNSRLTRSPFPRCDLTRHGQCKRSGSETNAYEYLGDDEPVNAARAGSNCRSNEGYDRRADQQALTDLECVGDGAEEWR